MEGQHLEQEDEVLCKDITKQTILFSITKIPPGGPGGGPGAAAGGGPGGREPFGYDNQILSTER